MTFTLSKVMKERKVMCYLMSKGFMKFTSINLEFSIDEYLHIMDPLGDQS